MSTPASSNPMAQGLSKPLAIKEVQEALVKANLNIKVLVEGFPSLRNRADLDQLNISIRAQVNKYRDHIQKLRQLSHIQKDIDAKEMLFRDVETHMTQMAEIQRQIRECTTKFVTELFRRDKNELFDNEPSSLTASSGQVRNRRNNSELLSDSGQVTDQLSALSKQLAAAVEQSSMTMDDLVQSSGTIKETQEEFQQMGAVIGQSSKLITKYGRRETTDKVLIFLAFAFFFAVVFYILRKRVLGPLDPFMLTWNALVTLINTLVSLVAA